MQFCGMYLFEMHRSIGFQTYLPVTVKTFQNQLDFDPRDCVDVCFHFSIHKLLFLNISGIYF